MKDEFTWLRVVILLSAGVLVLGLIVRVCRETAEQRARLEAATAEALRRGAGADRARAAALPPCRVVPAGWPGNGAAHDPE